MIHSLFIINSSGDVFMEKHWKSVIPRSICDYFFDAQRKANNNEDIPPVITTPHHYLISVLRSNLFFIAVCMTEVSLLAPHPSPCLSVSATLPTGQLSNVPWRRSGVKYTNNEAYFDVTEEVDAIIDKSGATVAAEIQGYIDCCIKLTGMPDLTLTFINPRLFDDVSFHPCVRLKRWESERVLSFVPPDGNSRLLSYHIGSQSVVAIPVYIRHNISFRDVGGGRLDITVGPKQTMGRSVEGVVLEVPMPKCVLNCTLTISQGKYTFDPVSKVLRWDLGRIDPTKLPNMRGNVQFTVTQLALSGLKVNRLDIYGEKYKPFKGVKYITKAGRFQVRT
ncbi:AP-3 complex subunit mu-1-like [Homarus americanus]|uniref:AP-3 complex subunit mu-1-like n=1 Tax=Homarus americanus TaxID=6706 RepID=A0A8J5JLF3_HOMAM|nr:AP-3 complex subunit mu-1-like [Homarus americanus]